MDKPKMENFIKEIPWTDSQGKERKAAGIDFASYAVALINYIQELEKTSGACTSAHVVIAVWRGVFDHAKAFKTREQADAYAQHLKDASPHMRDTNYSVATTTEEIE